MYFACFDWLLWESDCHFHPIKSRNVSNVQNFVSPTCPTDTLLHPKYEQGPNGETKVFFHVSYSRTHVKEMFYHGYGNYMTNAFPKDELCPISCTGRESTPPFHSHF
jgi:hypothetical protein